MKLLTRTVVLAVSLAATSAPAFAWQKTWSGYPWDKGCDKVNCYMPYTSYMKGHYRYIKCKDKTKFFTYKNGKYQCVSHKYVAK